MSAYQKEFEQAKNNPEKFWEEQAKAIEWYKFPKSILQKDENGIDRWYADGQLNTCFLALDYHVINGRAEQIALIYDSPVTGQKQHYTYQALTDQVARTAGMLADMGISKGDRVIIYMPMIPEAVMAMLACARLGAIHSVVFGGFAANELAIRLEDAEPKVIMTASCGIEVQKIIPYMPMVNKAIMDSRWKPEKVIVLQREQCPAELNSSLGVEDRDLDWSLQLEKSTAHDCVPVNANDPLYVLYTHPTSRCRR
ncbi:AMP-binding protein, partial [Psychromonas arctica]|uniref:AMP-binding protein n=1 Tax=Psychromonas arctica TaxID=168275 RepID=UPI0003F8E441